MDHHRDHNAHMQPGLEVVQQHLLYSQEPEVWNDSTYAKEMVVPKHTQQHYSPGPSQSPQAVLASLEEQERKRRRKRWFVIGGVVAAVVILAAVLGGVLGSKNASKSGGSSASNSIGTTSGEPSATALPQKLARQGSPLGVTTKRKTDGGADTFLFYQDRDGAVGYARCDSSRPLKDNESCWRTNGSFHTFASSNTQLAATDLVFETRFQAQTQLFYIGDEARLLGTNINDQSSPRIVEDSINSKLYVTGSESNLAAYWPWVIFQDSKGGLVHVRNNPPSAMTPASEWAWANINVTALVGTKLAMVPVSTNYTRIASRGGYGVFYQGTDSRLAVAITHLSEMDSTYPLSWPTNLPSITMPKRAPIAAVSVARPTDTRQRVDTYVMYLDSSSNINVLYSDSSSDPPTWKTSQPTALRGVDSDTNIACLTMATTPSDESGNEVMLEPASDDTKCFFQKGGVLTEARLKGTDWVVSSFLIAEDSAPAA